MTRTQCGQDCFLNIKNNHAIHWQIKKYQWLFMLACYWYITPAWAVHVALDRIAVQTSPPVAESVRAELASAVQQVVTARLDQVLRCYQERGSKQALVPSRLVLRVQVARSGKPDASILSSTLGDAQIEACVLQAVARWSFPPQAHASLVVDCPLDFLSGQPAPAEPAERTPEEKHPTALWGTGLAPKTVYDHLRKQIRTVSACYDTERNKRPAPTGRMFVQFMISPYGAVIQSRIMGSTLQLPEVELCVAKAIRDWTFPRPKQGIVIVQYPVSFPVIALPMLAQVASKEELSP